MRLNNRLWSFGIAMVFTMLPLAVHADTVTFSNVTFTQFTPNPIAAGSHPSTFGFGYSFSNSSGGSVNANLSIPIVLSPNATYGDSDDIALGTYAQTDTIGSGSGHNSDTAFAGVLTGITVPPATPTTYYNAFIAFGLSGGTSSIIAQLPLKVGVGVSVLGDYNGNGIVDAADYVWWRKNDGTAAGYNTWRTNFGHPAGSGSIAGGAIPEPASSTLAAFVLMAGLLNLPRRTGR